MEASEGSKSSSRRRNWRRAQLSRSCAVLVRRGMCVSKAPVGYCGTQADDPENEDDSASGDVGVLTTEV